MQSAVGVSDMTWKIPIFTKTPAHAPSLTREEPDSLGLTESDYIAAATTIGCEVAAIRAVAEVESAGRGFLPDGRPAILYEAHVFHRLTGGKYARERDRYGVPLSVPKWDRTLYGKPGAHQYERLEDAMKLDETNACFACSWGTYQIMGFNFASLGFPHIDTFREFMESNNSPRKHLDMFVRFIMVHGLDDELREKNWAAFARQYNGPQYAANKYDIKMRDAYERFRGA